MTTHDWQLANGNWVWVAARVLRGVGFTKCPLWHALSTGPWLALPFTGQHSAGDAYATMDGPLLHASLGQGQKKKKELKKEEEADPGIPAAPTIATPTSALVSTKRYLPHLKYSAESSTTTSAAC